MSFYLDTNAIYSYIFEDAHSSTIDAWVSVQRRALVVSDWADAEFYSLVRRRIRGGGLTLAAGQIGIDDFEHMKGEYTNRSVLSPAAGALAADLARDPALKLSAADALHLALSATDRHALLTFD